MRPTGDALAFVTALLLSAAAVLAQDGGAPHRPGRHRGTLPPPATRPATRPATTTALYTLDGGTATSARHVYTAGPTDVAAVLVAHGGTLIAAEPVVLGAGVRTESGGTLAVVGGTVATTARGAVGVVADGGTVTLTGTAVSTAGESAPAVHARGKVTATGSTLSAAAAEAVVVEGANSATFTQCTLAGNRDSGVLMFRPDRPGTAGRAHFTLTGGVLTTGRGPVFQVTNVTATIQLTDAAVSARGGVLVNAAGGRWGQRGHNGGHVTLKAVHQQLLGDLRCDPISTIDATLAGGTTLTGAVAGASLTIAGDSRWVVTGDSIVKALVDDGGVTGERVANIVGNGHTVRYDAAATVNAWLHGKTYGLANGGRLTPGG